jgi:hypothetical protein
VVVFVLCLQAAVATLFMKCGGMKLDDALTVTVQHPGADPTTLHQYEWLDNSDCWCIDSAPKSCLFRLFSDLGATMVEYIGTENTNGSAVYFDSPFFKSKGAPF